MWRAIAVLATIVATAGCTNSVTVQREAEVYSSLPFDKIDCAELTRQRNALATRHGLATDVERQAQTETSITGIGIVVPDLRSTTERDKARAIGEITAMNNSLTRRQCAG